MTPDPQMIRHRNPDFDDGLVVWNDDYSGHYAPAVYADQFDDAATLQD